MIKFGTSGWRGIIAKDFTYSNVAIVVQAIANFINEKYGSNIAVVILGYDTRFMSEDFAKTAAEVLAGNRIKTLFCNTNTPTPVIAYNIVHSNFTGGINFTASHNSYKYNGLKYSTQWGGPALPETTQIIEKYCTSLENKDVKFINFDLGVKEQLIKIYNPRTVYINKIKKLVNFKVLRKANIRVVTDVLHGTGGDYLDALLKSAGIRNTTINRNRDVMFDNGSPDPCEKNLSNIMRMVKQESYKLGFSTDGDADRFGIIDSDGTFITPNQVISVLLYHLNKTRGWTGVVARSVMTTHLIDKLANKIGIDVVETPVGFKYIGEVMVNNPNEFVIGGEESGGLTIRGHIPEKDGILACLLVAEAVAMSRKSIKELLKDVKKLTGEVLTARLNFSLPYEIMESFKNALKDRVIENIAGIKVKENITIDGHKFILDDNNWIGFRLSGTEPVVRLYAESDSYMKLNKILRAGKRIIYGK